MTPEQVQEKKIEEVKEDIGSDNSEQKKVIEKGDSNTNKSGSGAQQAVPNENSNEKKSNLGIYLIILAILILFGLTVWFVFFKGG